MRTFAAVHESGSGTKETVSPVAKGSAYWGAADEKWSMPRGLNRACGQTTDRKSCSNATDLFRAAYRTGIIKCS